MRALAPVPLLAALVLAGCLSTSSVNPATLGLPTLPAVPVAPLPIVQDHAHEDPALHEGAFATSLLATATGYDGPIPSGTGFGELDLNEGWAYVCRGGPEGGFVVVNVSQPSAPENVGSFLGVGCADIKVNDANDLVFYGTQRNAPAEVATSASPLPQKLPRGIYLVNVADKANPVLERFVPLPVNGVHTQHYVNQDGRELLYVQTYDWIPDGGLGTGVPSVMANPASQRVNIFEVVQGLDGGRDLRLLSVFQAPELAPVGTDYFPHDITVQKHPLTGQWLGYIAYWDLGLVIVNLDDPAEPRFVASFADTAPSAVVQLHQARPFPQLIAGRHVTVLEPELQAAEETGQLTLVDTTDPANPQRLGYWTLPGDLVIDSGFIFSPHNFNLANGRIYLAHNHAGVWVIDAGTEERLLQPQAVGYYQPHVFDREDGPECQGRTWSAFYAAGHVFASDSCSGLNILQFEGDRGLAEPGPFRVMSPQ